MSNGVVHFTPGPVEMSAELRALAGGQVPYFRNAWFSERVLACEARLLLLAAAPFGSRVVFLTCSGTGAMEAAVGAFAQRAVPSWVVDGGGFGSRWVRICEALGRPHAPIALPAEVALSAADLAPLADHPDGTLLCTAHETTTGVAHDLKAVALIAGQRAGLWVVDAISSFLCDPLDMTKLGIDVLVLGSQKALGLPPGLAFLVLSPRAVSRVMAAEEPQGSLYFDLRRHLRDGTRGQTPFTPAVATMLLLDRQLEILTAQGAPALVARCQALAAYFRGALRRADLPLTLLPARPSAAITALLCPPGINADALVRRLAEEEGLIVTPSGPPYRDRLIRVAHMGAQTEAQLDRLVAALSRQITTMEGAGCAT